MGLSDKLKRAACDAAYAVGRGVGEAERAFKDVAEKPAAREALASVRDVAQRAASGASSVAREAAEKVAPAVQDAARRAVPAVKDAARQAVPIVQDAARKAAPVVKQAAEAAGSAALSAARRSKGSASAATHAAAAAGKAAAGKVAANAAAAATKVAVENAAGMRDADARPREVVDPKTGQKVVVEAYVRRPDGSRDYGAVYPNGAKGDFGPAGNKVVGTLLIMAGVPMLVLPGPGTAAIAAGLYFLGKKSPAVKPQDPGRPENQADKPETPADETSRS